MISLALLLALAPGQEPSAQGVRSVDAAGDVEVHVRVDARAKESFRVEGGAAVSREKDTLLIRADQAGQRPTVTLVVTELERLTAGGKASIDAAGLGRGRVTVNASGAARITLEGRSDELVVRGKGTARLDAARLGAIRVDVNLSDAARAEVNASESLTCELARASRLVVFGAPRQVHKRVDGVAQLLMR